MKLTRFLKPTLLVLLSATICTSYAVAQGNSHGHGKGNKHDRDDAPEQQEMKHQGQGHYFRDSDYGLIRQYYSGPTNLPPGLRKKYARTGTLPPGWQKRFQPMPPVLIQQLPPIPAYCERGYLDGQAIVYDRRTRVILDSVDLISALSGR